MWPPNGEENHCSYGYVEHLDVNQHPHDHYHHHHHFPHSSVQHTECFQTLSCPSDLPIESSYFHHQHSALPPTYQELGQSDLSPQFWCAEVDCAHEKCVTKEIPHEQSKIFEEISKECDHILKQADCDKCKIQHDNGNEEAIQINDLVDIVMQTVDNLKKNEAEHVEVKLLTKKREQNKVAAARYRDKQKAKWQELLNNQAAEKSRNDKLKGEVAELEKEVAEMRDLVMGIMKKCP